MEEISERYPDQIDEKLKRNMRVSWQKKNSEILSKIPIWEDRIKLEIRKRKVKELYTNTSINPQKLQEGAKSFFDNNVWSKMSDIQKADLNDGCSIILLKSWTPAAMIIMRAIESSLRSHYKLITGSNPSGKNWGTILKDLHGHPSAEKKILNYFDYLKDYRNQIQHPDTRFDQSETEDMLNQAIHIFNKIYS